MKELQKNYEESKNQYEQLERENDKIRKELNEMRVKFATKDREMSELKI